MASNKEFDRQLTPRYSGEDAIRGEREKSTINVDQLSDWLMSREYLDRQKKILAILQNEKTFDKSQNYFRSREDMIKTALARAKRAKQLQVERKWEEAGTIELQIASQFHTNIT